MDIFNVLNMIGGLSLFLYGMSIMGNGLSKMAGGKLETILEKLTTKRIFAVFLGAGVTAVIQSSSATTVNKCSESVVCVYVCSTNYRIDYSAYHCYLHCNFSYAYKAAFVTNRDNG